MIQLFHRSPRLLVWGLVFALWFVALWMGQQATPTLNKFFPLIPAYLLIIGAGLWLVWRKEDPNSITSLPLPKNLLLMWSGFFATLALLRDSLILWAFSYLYIHDSPSYLYRWGDFTDLEKPNVLKRSIPYPLMTALVDAADHPTRMIALQVLVGALAVGLMVYVLSRHNWMLGGVIGLLLALDGNWGAANRAILTESAYTSFHLIALAWLLHHAWQWQQGEKIPPTQLILAGVFYGWTVTIRPSGLYFALAILFAYIYFSRRWRPASYVSLGLALFLLGSALFNLWRVDHFGISGRTGVFFGVPLFGYEVFSPENGEFSARLDADLRGCYENPAYEQVRNDYTYYILTYYRQCLNQVSDYDPDYESEMYTQAYKEAILADPVGYAQIITAEMGAILNFGVQNNLILVGTLGRPSLTCRETFYEYPWCADLPTAFRVSPYDKRVVSFSHIMIYPSQLYLLLIPRLPDDFWASGENIPLEQAPPQETEWAGLVAFIMLVGFLLVTTRGLEQLMVLGSAAYIFYVVGSVAFGHVFVGRYAQPLSPFYALLSGLFLTQIGPVLLPEAKNPLRLQKWLATLSTLGTTSALGLILLLFVQMQDQNAYASIVTQAEGYLANLESQMIYNPTPYHPKAVKWFNPAAFMDDELEDQDALWAWQNDLAPQHLAGLDYLVFDHVWWASLMPEQQAFIRQNYPLLKTWSDENQQIWLYAIPPTEE